jgi:Fe-S-cluster containining protein
MGDDGPLDAGEYAAWVGEFRQMLRVRTEVDVPCGECTACCRSSLFIHVGPDETDTLAHIPAQVLFPAPNQPIGHVLMGHDEHGNCPMLVDDRCSIYEHRPNTCRTYDCRVYAASGVVPDKPAIAARTRRWVFSYASEEVQAVHVTIRAAARQLEERTEMNPSQRASLAVERPDLFVPRG